MDSIRFDGIARELRSLDTRRGAVKTLAAAFLGFGVVRLGMADTGARKKNKKNKKKKKQKKQQNDFNTIALGQFCANSAQCLGDLICQIANSQNGFPERATQPVCCVPVDVQARCDSGADCCGVDVICNGGYCQSA